MQDWLIQLLQDHQYLFYFFVVFICIIEGPILTVLSGILVHLGAFPLIPIYIALVFGDLFGDVVWYWVGRKFGHPFVRKFGKYFSIEEKEISTVTHVFQKYDTRILIISKLTMGLGFSTVTLFTAGLVKVPFKKYFIINAAGQLFWTALLLAIGYIFGEWYSAIEGMLGKLSLVGLILLVAGALFGYGRYIKRRITQADLGGATS